MKLNQLKKKRLIIRNLAFKVNEEELKKIFSKFGEILQINIPLKKDGKKKGFAFVEFSHTKSMIKAMKELNFQKIHGRPVAIDFALNKNTYLSHQKKDIPISKRSSLKQDKKSKFETKDSDNENIIDSGRKKLKQEVMSEKDTQDSDNDDESYKCESESEESCDNNKTENYEDSKVKAFLKEFDFDDELKENSENEASSEFSEDEENESIHSNELDNHVDRSRTESKPYKKKQSKDVAEGKTVFIRNISFRSSEEDLQEVAEEFGETIYCLFCNDPVTDHFRGTAFVKFKIKESAEELIEKSSKEPGVLLDGRKLLCTAAVSREDLTKQRDNSKEKKDRRNLRLLKGDLVNYGSKESKSVSQKDMAKRAQWNKFNQSRMKRLGQNFQPK